MTYCLFKRAAAAALALSIATPPLIAQEASGNWDANADSGIDVSEFEAGLVESGLFSAWDTDEDGSLNEDELVAGIGDRDIHYAAWDADGDGLVREGEFYTGLYSNYDIDESGSLEEEEFGTFENERFSEM